MKQVRFHPEAQEELQKHEVWYRERSELAAQGFLLQVEHAIRSVAEAPERWPTGSRGEHRFVFLRYPFTLLYRIKGDVVFVTAVAHQSRRPGYWQHRK
jgi:toxin ParE1/3/4